MAHEVRISKTLSYILRHGAKKEGLKLRPDGYVKVSDIVRRFLLPIEMFGLSMCMVLYVTVG